MGDLRGRALWAWVVVCLVWGSTYLFIRVAVEALPPFLMAGVRWVVAGTLLLALARWRFREALPRAAAEWRTLALVGVLLVAGGNGGVVFAEQFVDSGTASIYVVTVTLWAAGFDALLPGGARRPGWRVMAGLLLGLGGTFLLIGVRPADFLAADWRGPLALLGASAAWAFGSVYLKRHPVAAPFSTAAALQMLAGGAALLLLALLRGEAMPAAPSPAALGAVAYLIVFGSLVGFTAYGYALRHASATVVGTYAYVNPVVAVLLGWLFLDEPLGFRKILAMGVILGAVLWIQSAMAPRPAPAAARPLPPWRKAA